MTGGWGPWRLDPPRLALDCYDGGRWVYEVDLQRCRTSAEALDWLAQISGKIRADDAVVAGLVRALDEVLGLQASPCGDGVERGPIDVRAVVRR